MADQNADEMVAINLNRFHECIDTWVPNEREGYKLYLNEESSRSKPSQEYVLTEYSWQNEGSMIVEIGRATISPETPSQEDINAAFDEAGLTPLSDAQYLTVSSAYDELTERVLRDKIFEGVPQLYNGAVYHEIHEFQKAMEQYLNTIQDKIERHTEEQDEDKERTYYDEYAKYGRLGDDQYHHIGDVLESAIEWENEDVVPYAQHCQLAAVLEFDTYEDWEIRSIEHLHNGVLVNKPALARTKALMEKGLNQKEIADKLGKDPSTVSRQVSSIEALEGRAEWSLQQKAKNAEE